MKDLTPAQLQHMIDKAQKAQSQVKDRIDHEQEHHDDRVDHLIRRDPSIWKAVQDARREHHAVLDALHDQHAALGGRISALSEIHELFLSSRADEDDEDDEGDEGPLDELSSEPDPLDEAEELAQRVTDGVATPEEVDRFRELTDAIMQQVRW